MMWFLGKSAAKVIERSRLSGTNLQYREFSSAAAGPTGGKIVEYCYKGAFCGVGYVVGGTISRPISKQVQEAEEMLIKELEDLDETEARFKPLFRE